METTVRRCDTPARMGGDEFTLVPTYLAHAADATGVVRKLRERLAEPVTIAGHGTVIRTSIGIAMYPDDDTDMDQLARKADIALYSAKEAGRDNFRCHDKKHELFDDSRLFLERELRSAIAHDSIYPILQPMVHARSGLPVGMEALPRWRHPDKGMIPPATFISLAEDAGLIKSLGQRMSRAAGHAAVGMVEAAELRLSMNVSALELRDDYVDSPVSLFDQVGLSARRVQLEIT